MDFPGRPILIQLPPGAVEARVAAAGGALGRVQEEGGVPREGVQASRPGVNSIDINFGPKIGPRFFIPIV